MSCTESATPTLNLTQPITDSTNSVNLPRPPTSPTRAPAPAPASKINQKPTNPFTLEGGQGSIVPVSRSNSGDGYRNEYESPTNLKGFESGRGIPNLGSAPPKDEPTTLNTIVDKVAGFVAGFGILAFTTVIARARNGARF
ncbi:MAG: hypothetical protein K2Y01_09455 [Rhabdochlamydiaceae bacterium]|nr:hypothetical protein [Rhabdochlamydiaceae bacterium]